MGQARLRPAHKTDGTMRALRLVPRRPPARRRAAVATAALPPLPPAGTLLASPANPFVKAVARVRDSRAARAEAGAVVLTGADAVLESCAPGGGATARVLVVGDTPAGRSLAGRVPAGRILLATPAVLAKLAGVKDAGEGAAAAAAIALVDAPRETDFLSPAPAARAAPRLLALDGVQDPGNVGTLARTALALGWGGLLLGAGCADALGPRALRAGRGAPFRLPFARVTDFAAVAQARGLALVAADAGGGGDENAPPPLSDPSRGVLLILGGERGGISPAVMASGAARVRIPTAGPMESLNVAAAGAMLMLALTPQARDGVMKELYGDE